MYADIIGSPGYMSFGEIALWGQAVDHEEGSFGSSLLDSFLGQGD